QVFPPMERFWKLARALSATSGVSAFRRAAPLYFGIMIVSTILFAGNGMRTADVVQLARTSLGFRLGLWGAWLVAAIPVTHALLEAPTTWALRALPVPRWHFWAIHGAHLAAAETPWLVLWGRGGGVGAAAVAVSLAAAAHALMVARPRRLVEWICVAAV